VFILHRGGRFRQHNPSNRRRLSGINGDFGCRLSPAPPRQNHLHRHTVTDDIDDDILPQSACIPRILRMGWCGLIFSVGGVNTAAALRMMAMMIVFTEMHLIDHYLVT